MAASRQYRIDYGSLGTAERTPQGGLAIPADLTRAGVFHYLGADGSPIKEWRPRSEVSRPATLESLKNSPFTLGHPAPGEVRPENYARFAKGHVGSDVRMDGDKTAATIYAQDKEALRAIEGGKRDISCGYHCDTDNVAGVVPEGEPDAGMRYDRVQRNIVYNHTALVDRGRAGPSVRLRLDADGNATFGEPMEKIEVIGGIEYGLGTDAHRDARKRQDEADKASAAEVVKLRADSAKLQGERDVALEKVGKLTAELAEANSPKRLDAAVTERVAVLDVARAHLGKDFKADGLGNREIQLAVLKKVYPEGAISEKLRTDAADKPLAGEYVAALWDALAIKPAQRRTDSAGPTPRPLPSKVGGMRSLRQDSIDANEERWRRPLRLSSLESDQPLQAPMLENQR